MKKILSRGALSLGVMGTLFALSGCGSDTLPDYVQLGPLRVLAIPVGTDGSVSEAAPGQTVALTPWVSWLEGEGSQAITWSTAACRDPGVAYGAEPTCEGAPDRVEIGAGAGGSGSAVIGSSADAWTAPLPAPIQVTIPADFFVSPLPPISAADQESGWAYLVELKLTAGDETLTTLKRIIVTTRTGADLNTNPTIDQILANESPLTIFPTSEVDLQAQFSGVQTTATSSFAQNEDPVVTWFFSDGEYQRFRTTQDNPTNEWIPPQEKPAARAVVIVAVLRDGRGGESVRLISL